jgi:hypothetical protein
MAIDADCDDCEYVDTDDCDYETIQDCDYLIIKCSHAYIRILCNDETAT